MRSIPEAEQSDLIHLSLGTTLSCVLRASLYFYQSVCEEKRETKRKDVCVCVSVCVAIC